MRTHLDSVLRFLLKPYGVIPFTVALSLIGWLFNGYFNDLDSFRKPEPLFSGGGEMVMAWYASMVVVSVIFFSLGRKIRIGVEFLDRFANLSDFSAYLLLSVGALIGTYACVNELVQNLGWKGVWEALVNQESHIFYLVTLSNYHRGILTLRYCAPVCAGLAIYRIAVKKRISILDILNFALLIVVVIAANVRLFFVASIVFGVGLYILNHRVVRMPLFRLMVFGAVVFFFLTLFNSARNGTIFRQNGDDSAISSNMSEIAAYLGTPFQVSLAVGNKYEAAKRGEFYTQLAAVHSGMSTNSVFYIFVHTYGDWAWPLGWLEVSVLSFFMGVTSYHRRNYLIVAYLATLYIMAEFWRTTLLFSGGFIFIIFGSIFGTIGLACLNKVLGREVEIEEDELDEDNQPDDREADELDGPPSQGDANADFEEEFLSR